jgi:hypothetical protein
VADYTNTDTPTISEHDASLSLWWDNPEDPRIPGIRQAVIRHLRDRGFRIYVDPQMIRNYSAGFARNYHQGTKGDLWVRVERSGRCLEIKFWQEIVTENRNGGRYDFDRRKKMGYTLCKRYELERNLLVAALGFPFEPCKQASPLRGIAFIADKRTNRKETFFPCPLGQRDSEKERRNSMGAAGALIHDGDEVFFRTGYSANWRIQRGIAYHNINNMWWILLPDGAVRNLASYEIAHAGHFQLLPSRIVPHKTALDRIGAVMAKAVAAEDFERAAILRDAKNAMPQVKA